MRKFTDQQFLDAIKNNSSILAVLKELGLALAGGSYKSFHAGVKRLKADTSHFTGQGHLKNKSHDWSVKIPLKDILIKNSLYAGTSYLHKRLVKEGILEDKCSKCGINSWQGEKLSLHLDHIDGVNNNNEVSNLRLLCPNCHSQTPTYCGRNKKKK